MKKKLNVEGITNELRGNSAFFPRYKEEPVATSASAPVPPAATPSLPSAGKVLVSPAPQPKDTVVQSSKRSFVRRSFDFYEDQISYLTRASLEERLAGREGSMNAMVREAIDDYIKKRKTGT